MNLKKILLFEDSKITNIKIFSALLFLLFLSSTINFTARIFEKNLWEENPLVFESEGTPLLRSGDPAYFFNMAKYLKKDIPVTEYQNKLYYPMTSKVVSVPILSKLISYLANDSSFQELFKAGNKLVLISSVLTSIGIFSLFFSIGRPFEGVVASAATGITTAFYFRSGIGYFDTDILNLFFMYTLFAAIYMASRKQSWYLTILYIFFAGLIGKCFNLWYSKDELIIMSFISLVFFSTTFTKDWKKIIFNSSIYIILTGPNLYISSLDVITNNPYLAGYLSANIEVKDLINQTNLNFNSIFRFIGEQQKLPLIDIFKLEGSVYLGLACFLGFILWGISYPMVFLGLIPLSLFFLLSILIGQRAIFYSIPFMWFGLSYFVNFATFKIIFYKKIQINKYIVYFFTSLMLITFAVFFTNAFNKNIGTTYISSNTTKAMIKMNDLVADKDNSVIATSWTYGYQSLLYNDIPILIHPGSPTSPRHYFISRAITSFDLEETKKIINYIVTGNVERISEKEIDNFNALSKDLYKTPMSKKDVYLMLTQQQRLWMKPEGATAYWDIENNKPYLFDGKTAFDIFSILEINCDDLDTRTFTTKCAEIEGSTNMTIPVNLALGTWDEKPILKRVVQISDGKVEINEEYKNSEGNMVFQIVKNVEENTSNLYMMHDVVFRSAYNKLFHLNQSDNYELIYDDYPYVKIYKIN